MCRKQVLFLFLFIAACASHDPIYSDVAPSWVNSVRTGDSTLRIIQGDKILFRSNFKGEKGLTQKETCDQAIHQNILFIRQAYPFAEKIPTTTELVFFDPVIKDCTTTVSVPLSVINELEKTNQGIKKRITSFTEVAGNVNCHGAPVEIDTTPQGAFVTLDNGKYQGFTPIKFGNVCNGKYDLEISLAHHKDVQETLRVPTSGRVSRTLARDQKNITLRTNLNNAYVTINGIDKGREPVKFSAPLGAEQEIELTHDEAMPVIYKLVFSKESNATYLFNMEKKPARIDFSAFKQRNPDVQIYVDGNETKTDVTKELKADMTHQVRLTKKGFADISRTITLKGGETTYYPAKSLTFPKKETVETSRASKEWLGVLVFYSSLLLLAIILP